MPARRAGNRVDYHAPRRLSCAASHHTARIASRAQVKSGIRARLAQVAMRRAGALWTAHLARQTAAPAEAASRFAAPAPTFSRLRRAARRGSSAFMDGSFRVSQPSSGPLAPLATPPSSDPAATAAARRMVAATQACIKEVLGLRREDAAGLGVVRAAIIVSPPLLHSSASCSLPLYRSPMNCLRFC